MPKRLTIAEKLEIINDLSKPNHATKTSLGRKFGVSEAAIRNIWKNRDVVRQRSADLPQDFKNKKSKVTVARYVILISVNLFK